MIRGRNYWHRRPLLSALSGAVVCLALTPALQAQTAAEKKIPPPEDVSLQTGDGVELKATFYPGTKGKESVPVMMLHMWKGSRADYDALARYLQQLGHAVIVPDLRGHGRSTRIRRPGREPVEMEAALLKAADFQNMVRYDVESVKSYLLEKNNAGELNIEKLTVVGAEMGASVAINWAALDWSWQQLPNLKQGRDVKALVLISPEFAFKGMPIKQAISSPAVRQDLSMMFIVGAQDPRAVREARRIYTTLERFHPLPAASERAEKQDLFFLDNLKTSLQGTKILGERALTPPPEQQIAQFIQLRLVAKSFPWTNRKNPLQ